MEALAHWGLSRQKKKNDLCNLNAFYDVESKGGVCDELQGIGREVEVVTLKTTSRAYLSSNLGKAKVKCTLVQALRLCTGRMAHRGNSGTVLPILDQSTRRG